MQESSVIHLIRTYTTNDPAKFIRESARAEPAEAQPFDGAQGERDSWLIRAGSMGGLLRGLPSTQ